MSEYPAAQADLSSTKFSRASQARFLSKKSAKKVIRGSEISDQLEESRERALEF
jgi:hypothetical protein